MGNDGSRIEINGRVYDSKTGKTVRVSHSKKSVVNSMQVIDGFVRPSQVKNVVQQTTPVKLRTFDSQPTANRTPAKMSSDIHSKPQRTNRLHPAVRGTNRSEASKPASTNIRRLGSDSQNNIRRASRSSQHLKSTMINRHNKIVQEATADVVEQAPDLPAMPMVLKGRFKPTQQEQPQIQAQIEEPDDGQNHSWYKKYLIPAVSSFAALALFSGFLIYNNLPNLTMRVAASRAGFNATVPNYNPNGFKFEGPVAYGPGRVVISFASNTDDREYTITQKSSTWDSQSLIENFVAKEAENYLTYSEKGLTIYLYNTDNATWVDNGVWYVVEGSAKLNSEQILKIASSL